jgi:hypothetical protein
MRQSLFTSKISKTLLLAAAATLAFGRMSALNAAVVHSAAPNAAADTMIAFDNACADDDLAAGDEVTVDGDDLALEEDADGLFIAVNGESYSVVSFDADCETVNFQQVDGVDTLSGNDVDEEESSDANADEADDSVDETADASADDSADEMDDSADEMDDSADEMDDSADEADDAGQ